MKSYLYQINDTNPANWQTLDAADNSHAAYVLTDPDERLENALKVFRHSDAINLMCELCNEDAGTFRQHWNCAPGFGICHKCAVLQLKSWIDIKQFEDSFTETDARKEFANLYGIEGINFERLTSPAIETSTAYDARLGADESFATLDCGCSLQWDGDSSDVLFTFCPKHKAVK